MAHGGGSRNDLLPLLQAAGLVAAWLTVLGMLTLLLLAPRVPYLRLLPGVGVVAAAVAVAVVLFVSTRLVFGRFFGMLAVGITLAVVAVLGGLLRADATARSGAVRWYTEPPPVELPEELPDVAPAAVPAASPEAVPPAGADPGEPAGEPAGGEAGGAAPTAGLPTPPAKTPPWISLTFP